MRYYLIYRLNHKSMQAINNISHSEQYKLQLAKHSIISLRKPT